MARLSYYYACVDDELVPVVASLDPDDDLALKADRLINNKDSERKRFFSP